MLWRWIWDVCFWRHLGLRHTIFHALHTSFCLYNDLRKVLCLFVSESLVNGQYSLNFVDLKPSAANTTSNLTVRSIITIKPAVRNRNLCCSLYALMIPFPTMVQLTLEEEGKHRILLLATLPFLTMTLTHHLTAELLLLLLLLQLHSEGSEMLPVWN